MPRASGHARLGLVFAAFLMAHAMLRAEQPAPAREAFEVASVKRNTAGSPSFSFETRGGLVRISNMPLRVLIAEAYEIGGRYRLPDYWSFRLIGGPGALLSMRFDVTARTHPDATPEAVAAMLRTLLTERFRLRLRAEPRQMPVYAVTVDPKGPGPHIRPTDIDCLGLVRSGVNALNADERTRARCWPPPDRNPPRNSVRQMSAGPVAELLRRTEPFLDRVLLDETGLTGSFQWQTRFAANADSDAPSIFEAFRRDLGLRIQPTSAMVPVFVIESVELPDPD
jgi:uncharacterized protein (TIGR03435 family)